MGAFADANPAGRPPAQARSGLGDTATIRCAEFDLWLHLLKEAYEFVAADPINSMATEKMNYVLREMGLARRR